MTKNLSDQELIDAVLAGKTAWFEELVKRHQRYVFTLAMRFSGSREDAEEIAQDAFVKAYRSLINFKGNSKFSTWIYTIVYTTAMSFLRKKKLITASLDDDENPIQINLTSGDHASNLIENKIQTEYINKAIKRLLPDDAAIITLFYQHEQSLDEIAQIMNMPSNTVKVKLHRSRQRLKIQLERLLNEEVNELI